MILVALLLNLVILIPLTVALANGSTGMDAAFGGVTDARRILTAIYAAIGCVSAVLIVLHALQHPWAMPMTVGLFAVQITYKVMTVPLVGLASPVVLTNLLVVAVQVTALALLYVRSLA